MEAQATPSSRIHPNANIPSTAVSSSSVMNGINTSPVWTSPPLPNASVSSSGNHCNDVVPPSSDLPPQSIHLSNGEVLSKPLGEKFLKESSRSRLINCDGALSPALSTSSVSFSPERNKQLTNGPIHSSPSDHTTTQYHKQTCNNLVNDKARVQEQCNCTSDISKVTYSNLTTTSHPVQNHIYDGHNGPVPASLSVAPSLQSTDRKDSETLLNPDPKLSTSTQPTCNGLEPPKKISLHDDSAIPGRGLPPLLMTTGISEDLPARDVITMCR